MKKTIEIEWWRTQSEGPVASEEVLEQHQGTLLEVALIEIRKQQLQRFDKGNFDGIRLPVDQDTNLCVSYRGYWELS